MSSLNSDPPAGGKDRWGGAAAGPARAFRRKSTLLALAARGVPPQKTNKIRNFSMCAVRQFDWRLLKGETIPQNEKVFSNFEPHTRWISKGKAGCPVELGVPVCIVETEFWISSCRVRNAPNDVWDDNFTHFDLGLRENVSRYAR